MLRELSKKFVQPAISPLHRGGEFAHLWGMSKKTNAAKSLRLNKTQNDLPEKTRAAVVALLNARLADAADLKSQVKQAHWNVKGQNFIALHELFDDLAGRLEEQIDDLAERAVQLGGTATGTVRMAAAASTLPEFPTDIRDGIAHVQALVDRYAIYGKASRAAIDSSDQAGDADTADLFTGISRAVDKDLWFLEAHLG